jgi:hypothetical protein
VSDVTARPAELDRYADVAADVRSDLAARGDDLRAALDDFRASPDWYDHVSDVPPLDIDLAVVAAHVGRLGAFTARVAAAFVDVDEDGLAAASADLVDRRAGQVHPPGIDLIRDGDRWIVNGTDQPDHVQVTSRGGRWVVVVRRFDPRLGWIDVGERVLTDAQAEGLTIRTGGGNDIVEVAPDVTLRLTVWAGDGDDVVGWHDGTGHARVGGGGDTTIFLGGGDDVALGGAGDDRIYGGEGRDIIEGGDGDDLLVGGDGDDTIYGGRGDDVVHGGRGDDFLAGGSGNDRLHGGPGDDVLSGGTGDDVLRSGRGDDVLVGGSGRDLVDGGSGTNRTYTTAAGDDRIRNGGAVVTLEVRGDEGGTGLYTSRPDWMSEEAYDAWRERLASDLELLRHTPAGNEGLRALDDASAGSHRGMLWWRERNRVLILPYGTPDEASVDLRGNATTLDDWARRGSDAYHGNFASGPGGRADDAFVAAGGLHDSALDERPPIASLYHELAHSFDQLSGGTERGSYTERIVAPDGTVTYERTDVPIAEVNAVGIDVDGDGRFDTRPSRDGTPHPAALTENALRDDLGRPRRPGYTTRPDDIGPDDEVSFDVP